MPGLGTSFGRGGATTAQQDLANADCILIEGSSLADYVVHFTNASCILREDFRDTDEGTAGFFSGWNEQQRAYDKETWFYEGHPDLSFPERDLTLQHPRCVFQTLRRHFARYTPDMVEKICGISPALFHKVADAVMLRFKDRPISRRSTTPCPATW